MFKLMFAIYDSKMTAYADPFFAPTRGVACRNFMAACEDPNSNLNRFAADYTLFELGQFDLETGKYLEHHAPVNLGTALSWLSTANANTPAEEESNES